MNKRMLTLSLLMLGMMGAASAQFSASDLLGDGNDGTYKGDVSGQTFFVARNPFYFTPVQISQWNRRALMGPCGFGRECGIGGAIQVVPFGGRSTRSNRLGRYFGFNGRNVLTAGANFGGAPQPTVDINAANFGISYATSFTSQIALNPRQSIAGVAFEWRQYLGWFGECAANWWLDIAVPVVRVRNDMRLTETARSLGDQAEGTPANLTQAFAGATSSVFSGTGFVFGRIDGARKRTGVADVQLKLGLDALCTDCCYVNGYVGVSIPTGNRPRGVFVWEPIVGYARHVGLLWGSALIYDIWSNCDRSLSWEVNLDSMYLFKARETRSFDLKNRPWSRYLPVYANAADATAEEPVLTPGINVFTREMNVTPRFQTSVNSALVYTSRCGFVGELGYNFWARQAEKVSLRNTGTGFFGSSIAIAAIDASNGPIAGSTNLLSTIGNNNSASCLPGEDCTDGCTLVSSALVPFVGNTLTLADIDLSSASHPAVISNIVYGTLGYGFEWCVPMLLSVGGSYEFSPINTALNRWTVWGKIGVSF